MNQDHRNADLRQQNITRMRTPHPSLSQNSRPYQNVQRTSKDGWQSELWHWSCLINTGYPLSSLHPPSPQNSSPYYKFPFWPNFISLVNPSNLKSHTNSKFIYSSLNISKSSPLHHQKPNTKHHKKNHHNLIKSHITLLHSYWPFFTLNFNFSLQLSVTDTFPSTLTLHSWPG